MLENVGAAAAARTWCCSWSCATRSWRPSPGAEPVDAGRRLPRGDRRGPAARARAGDRPAAPAGRADRRRAGRRDRARRCSTPTSTSSGATCCEARMAELQLKSHRFRAEREADWRRLEALLGQAERRSARGARPTRSCWRCRCSTARAVVAVGGAGDLARPGPDRLSGEPLHARLFLRLRRARRRCWSGWRGFFARDWPARGPGRSGARRWSARR